MRVIGGQARGRRLHGPGVLRLRPTPDRVREALFSILAAQVDGTTFLDLFAGTGAIAIEALSRGAAGAVLVEAERDHAALARRNLDACGLPGARLLEMPVASALERLAGEGGRFGLVYLDPPYADAEIRRGTLARLARGDLLAPGSRLILELPAREEAPTVDGLHPEPPRRYGDTALAFFTVASA